MKCKINYELSKMQEFKSDPTKKYLQAVFVPVGMGLLQGLASRNAAQLTMNIFPGRDRDGNIDAEQSKVLQEAFDKHTFDEFYYVARVPVTVEPFLMTYTTDTANTKKGEIIKDGDKVRIYDYVSVTSFMVLDANNQEVPLLSENELRSRANSVRNFRIKQGQWYDAATYGATIEPTDDGLPPTEDLNHQTETKPEDDAEYQAYLAQKRATQKPVRF